MEEVSFEGLTDEFVLCRMYRSHAWFEVPNDTKEKPELPGWYWMVQQCARCTTLRYDLCDSNHDVQHRDYDYVDGYQVDSGRISTREMRQEWAERHRVEEVIDTQRTKRKKKNGKKPRR